MEGERDLVQTREQSLLLLFIFSFLLLLVSVVEVVICCTTTQSARVSLLLLELQQIQHALPQLLPGRQQHISTQHQGQLNTHHRHNYPILLTLLTSDLKCINVSGTRYFGHNINQSRICGKEFGLGLFPSDSLQSQLYEFIEIAHIGPYYGVEGLYKYSFESYGQFLRQSKKVEKWLFLG